MPRVAGVGCVFGEMGSDRYRWLDDGLRDAKLASWPVPVLGPGTGPSHGQVECRRDRRLGAVNHTHRPQEPTLLTSSSFASSLLVSSGRRVEPRPTGPDRTGSDPWPVDTAGKHTHVCLPASARHTPDYHRLVPPSRSKGGYNKSYTDAYCRHVPLVIRLVGWAHTLSVPSCQI
ncbi:unnamed protein product [Protopolystoma xenopodis]|uniref:Uncharacterized protein n=1 Tax=Protopolystoma xenopodis TaxID=117903 RepID=A0A3S5B2B0_9PLAT|nr:unnamed protein product [Protopolystoma xenopodis]